MSLSKTLLLLSVGCLSGRIAQATVRLPKLVGDNMVLQRDAKLPIWGWADAGETVTVTFRGKSYTAKPGGSEGKWTVMLPATPSGGPYDMTIKGSNTLQIKNILIGDVWLASGQSNMEMPVKDQPGGYSAVRNADQEVAGANFPQIHFLDVKNTVASKPQRDIESTGWQVCSPQTVAEFSAVAYFFGRDLYQRYHVPIGLISSTWGGTEVESWTSAEALKVLPDFRSRIAAMQQEKRDINQIQTDYINSLKAWQNSPAGKDHGRLPDSKSWADPDFNAQDWKTMNVPGLWEQQPELSTFDGVVWFRKEVTLPAANAGKPLQLALGQIDDNDSTWFNGVLVGTTSGYSEKRRYTVPATLVKEGRNVVAVRVVDNGGGGGLWGLTADFQLIAGAGSTPVPLAGAWQYKPAYDPASVPKTPFPKGLPNNPTVLYNGMIAPLIPYALKGFIWYQGESNSDRAYQYRTLFPTMIKDWRTRWEQGDLPFLFVQLANYQHDQPQPAEYEWAELREAQAMTLSLPKTGMATTIDIGSPDDIHPLNKQDVGKRLALAAQKVAYGDTKIVASGPTFKSMQVQGKQVRLTFDNVGGGLILKDKSGDYLKGFAIAGADHKFVWAKGELQGNTLVLSSDQVPAPTAVRYDWSNNPFPNLYNKEGLPAYPFRTDQWPGLTVSKK
ncbi:sialate O-acetylesterase [Hymenobacter sp. BT491]|uniref:sialate O-acetylesterase n=1 Tax=Hymenobacter sp. BT491 TaxID=2766779 RepID=UPI0016535D1C|nr:sialate O-acetylesterase [Hymenobacter sp. BT491]MBC6991166.1 9-O-acetylesterase [Hymenobacter sp. BT491]